MNLPLAIVGFGPAVFRLQNKEVVMMNYCRPLRVVWHHGTPYVVACGAKDMSFVDAFFTDTVRMALAQPSGPQLVTAPLREMATAFGPPVPLAGFIFHISRCGSTVITRSLAVSRNILVLSEPTPVMDLLAFPSESDQAELIELLQLLITGLSQPTATNERYCLIKFSSLHSCLIPLICAAFPTVPWIFVYRHPVEVMVSVLKSPTGYMNLKNSPSSAGFYLEIAAELVKTMSNEEYAARFLRQFCLSAIRQMGVACTGRYRLIEYSRLPRAVLSEVLPFFNLKLDIVERCGVERASYSYSKDPSGTLRFIDDTKRKQAAASPEISAAASGFVWDVYSMLRRIDYLIRLRASSLGDGSGA